MQLSIVVGGFDPVDRVDGYHLKTLSFPDDNSFWPLLLLSCEQGPKLASERIPVAHRNTLPGTLNA
jgi:hypothetical protein